MTVSQFEELVELVREPLTKCSIRESLSAEHRSTVSKIVQETCQVIWEKLSSKYFPYPGTEEFLQYAQNFKEIWNLPNCIGAVDGKHVTVQSPYNSGSNFFNYKKTFSVVLLAVCDANYVFTLVDVGASGSQSDGGIFKASAFGQALENNELCIPDDCNLPDSNIGFPYYFVGDEAFPLKRYMMRPYPGTGLSLTQKIFNYRLSRARRVIENAFGILVNRWRIFRSTIIADVNTVEFIICATLCLHNFLRISELSIHSQNRMYCHVNYGVDERNMQVNEASESRRQKDKKNVGAFQRIGRLGANNSSTENLKLRDNLANYLVSVAGAVSW
ncbi:PREDICTED: putative nuclease HARBI1 [Cyphomyrmex costatus]|uniref:putative nuclease HARBI1 n=1 Tax=Cyphomyrmex costatus TaxID=456900 RepID=UPI0008522B2B|nr:PREDICTED: putative nuclease HARBI1 [Cyphomyrmex costatus]